MMNNILLVLVAVATGVLIMIAIRIGFGIGVKTKKIAANDEREASVSVISGSILSLLAFILAFTFSLVTNRYDTRRQLVREEANIIRTTWQRTEFLPEADRTKAVDLLREYLALRLRVVESPEILEEARVASAEIYGQLWNMAVVNARKDMNSDVAALYIESLNDMAAMNVTRVAIGAKMKVPKGIWVGLYILVFLGMLSVGYQIAISDAKITILSPVLAVSFAMVMLMIFAIDSPRSKLIPVSQGTLIDLKSDMEKSKVPAPGTSIPAPGDSLRAGPENNSKNN